MLGRGGRCCDVLEVVSCIEEGVAIELEGVPVKAIGAGLECSVNDAAGVTVILSVQRAGDQVELADRVEIGIKPDGVERKVR